LGEPMGIDINMSMVQSFYFLSDGFPKLTISHTASPGPTRLIKDVSSDSCDFREHALGC
jgi:hypothetical protein